AKSWERGNEDPPNDEVKYSEEPMEVEPARRAASATFDVQANIGGEASLREAMDPANQSLAEALKLSYRILQIVILVLIVLFLGSGIQTVHEGQTGIRTVWGKADQEALTPGLKLSIWPYPIGEFVIIDADNLHATDGDAFWPNLRGGSWDQAVSKATSVDRLMPGRDGSILTAGGDPAHVKIEAVYEIADPVSYLRQVDAADAAKVVQAALQRAMIHCAAGWSQEELLKLDQSEDQRRKVQDATQQLLDEMKSGIEIVEVKTLEKPSEPLAVVSSRDELAKAIQQKNTLVESARDQEEKQLISVVGPNYKDILDMIEAYETKYEESGDAGSQDELAKINAFLNSDKVGGDVSLLIEKAKTYSATIDQTLGAEAKRFELLYPAYQHNPILFVRQRLDSVLSEIYSAKDIEVFNVPPGIGNFLVSITGQQFIQDLRRKEQLDQKNAEAQKKLNESAGTYFPLSSDLGPGPSRQLNISDNGTLTNKRSEENP
ncbi:MAG TPA: hypothetical protein VG711_11600, partial [Phycisphaerales bacterium]|nr:hypothetical protein [Phycisphaerales bacterium]